jgi:hypothetical protein
VTVKRVLSKASSVAGGRAEPLPVSARAGRPRHRPPALISTLRRGAGPALPALLILSAAALWTTSLQTIHPERIGDIGLVSALPTGAFVALALACVSFSLVLRREDVLTPLALLHLALLIFMLYGATSLIDNAPSLNVVWRHAGVTDYITTTGGVDPRIDAYFNWPGFFFWAGLVTRVAGAHSVLEWSNWSAVAFELAYLPPLVVIARAFTADRRLAWSAVWIFYLTNWVGQDYFSPQAMAYLWYLALVAVALTYLSRRGAPRLAGWRARGARPLVALRLRPAGALTEPSVPAAPGARQGALVLVCVVIFAATVASHQLTPWMMLGSIAALVLLGRCSARGLPTIMLVLLTVWLTYMAASYLGGHLKPLLGQALDVNGSVSANVGSRLSGSPGHLFVVHMRLAMTGALWLLAVVGLVRGLRHGRLSPGHMILALSAPAFVVLQRYGGEMLLRVYLFTLPFTACYVAQALAPVGGRWRDWRAAAVVAATSAALLCGFLYTRYGNQASTIFVPGEVQAVDRLYEIAPHGSDLVAASSNVAWKQQHYADYHYQLLGQRLPPGRADETPAQLADEVARSMGETGRPAYLLITRAQLRYDELMGSQAWGSVSTLRKGVISSPRFTKVFDNRDGQIFRLRLPAPRSTG